MFTNEKTLIEFCAKRGRVTIAEYIVFAMVLSSHLTFAQVTDPSLVGQWSTVQSFPYMPAHTHVMYNGVVLFWPTFDVGNNPQLWNPSTNGVTAATFAPYNIFCAGHSFLANGKLLVTGGQDPTGNGLPNASIYDPISGTWTQLPDMNQGRWYPTNTTLANGDVLVVSGQIDPSIGNDALPQVWQAGSNTWRNLTTAQLTQPLYPSMFLLPNGKVFNAGPSQTTRSLDTTGTGAWTFVAYSKYGSRDYGPAVMYQPGKIILIGGGGPTNTAETIDMNAASPAWSYAAPMTYPRRQANATILPDGTVFVSGGSSGSAFDDETAPVYPTELWNPLTNTWTTLASVAVYRGYHSTSVLLPDGRVMEGGGEKTGATYQIFSPPYLFHGTRPTISSTPSGGLSYGQTFFVGTPSASSIGSVTLLGLDSTTHTFDQNQRFNQLAFTQTTGGLNVISPANANLAPPGYYMLFIISSTGVPSVAAIVQLAPGSSRPATPSNLSAAAASGSKINLRWTDNSNNESGFSIERSVNTSSNFTQIATVGAGVTNYADSGLTVSTFYYYRVRAFNASGNSAYSNTAKAKTLAH